MTIEWDDESQPQSGITWDDEPKAPKERDTSLVGQAKEFGMNAAGGAQAIADFALGIPGMVGAGTAALTHATGIGDEKLNTGRSPMETFQEAMQSAQASDPAQYLPERFQPKDLRESEGYKVVNDLASNALSMFGQGVGNIGALATDLANKVLGTNVSPSNAGEAIDVIAQVSALVGGFLGKEGPKPGTVEFRNANEPTGVNARKGYGPEYDPDAAIPFEPGPKRAYSKSGTFDTTKTETEISSIDYDKTGAYTYKNKDITQKTDQWDYHKGSDIPGIDFTTFSVEDPKQIADLQSQLKDIGVTSDINQTRVLAQQMKDKMALADERAQALSHTISKRIPPTALTDEAVVNGYKQINASPMNKYVEIVDTRLMELMRDHDRLTEPKGRNQFLEKENSVLNNGVNKGLTLWYWPEEGRIVQENGNTRRGVAAKHGLQEIPAYVRIQPGKVPDEWQRSAVSIPGLRYEGEAKGQFAKPSDIGLPSRTLNEGVFNPKVKYAPNPTVDTVRLPDGYYQNNHLAAMQWNEMAQWGARKGLQVLRDTSSIPFYKAAAKLLLDDPSFNPNFAIREKSDEGYRQPNPQTGDKGTGGQYRSKTYETSVRRDMVGNEYVFMHEMVHARTHSLIQSLIDGKLDRMHPSYDATKRLIELWQTLHTDAGIEAGNGIDVAQYDKNRLGIEPHGSPLARVAAQYGITDPHEFVAEAFTNPEFQNLLKQISLPDHLQPKRGFKYYWDEFVGLLGKIMNFTPDQNNYMAATIQAATELMRTSNKQDRMYYALEQHPESWYPRNVGAPAGNVVDSMIEAKKIAGIDRRPLQDVVQHWKKTDVEDLSDVTKGSLLNRLWGLASISGRNLADARTMQAMIKDVKGAGELVKNVFDKVFLTNRWVKAQIDETMKGKEFETGVTGRFEHRYGSRDGIDSVFKTTSEKDMQEVLKKWIPAQGQDPLTRSSFANDKQWNAFNIINNQLQRAHELFNDLRLKLDKPYIEPVKNYFPFERGKGDYKVLIKDSMGNDRYVKMFENIGQAQIWAKEMKNKMPYLDVKDPVHREPYNARETDLDVWAEALRINNKDDELNKIIHRAAVEALTKQGMGGHLLPKKIEGGIVEGFLGSDYNVREAQQGLREYVEYAYNYAGNLNKQLIHKDIVGMKIEGKSLAEIAPNLNTYLNQFMEKAKGSANVYDQSEKIFFGLMSQAMGYGASAPTRGTAKLSRFAMTWYLFKTGFFVTQPFQTFNALPHLVDMTGSLAAAAGHYLLGVQRALVPGSADRAAVNWAIRNQHIDPTVNHMLDEYDASVPTRLFLKTTGTIERELVRIPAFLAFESALRDTIKDPIQRYEAAADKMAFSMSMTDRSNSPLIWEKLGIVGQGMKQLKSYSTNIWGQFAYLTQQAGKGNMKPLGTFMATQALLGGIKGMVMIPEATAAIVAFNALTNSNVDTPAEYLLKKGTPTSLVYGLGSTALTRDISNQVGNPSGFNYLDPIPFKLAATVVTQNIEYAVAAAQDQLTDDIRMKTWLANTPPALHELVRNRFTKPGQPVPTPGMDMKGRYFREFDKNVFGRAGIDVAAATGTRSVEESKADDLQRFFKQHEQRLTANKSNIANSMVDDILNGQSIGANKIQDYVQSGGDVHNLANDLKQSIIARSRLDIYNQILNKSKTTAHAKALQEVQPYLNNLPQEEHGTIEWDK